MRCKEFERLIFLSLDGRISEHDKVFLTQHLKTCSSCQKLNTDYVGLHGKLRDLNIEEEPPADFWKKLEPRLQEEQRIMPLVLFERWSLRSIPVFLTLAIIVASLFFLMPKQRELSQPEMLLLSNENPLTETNSLLEENKSEQKNMMLIFASLEGMPVMGRKP